MHFCLLNRSGEGRELGDGEDMVSRVKFVGVYGGIGDTVGGFAVGVECGVWDEVGADKAGAAGVDGWAG